jgi:ATP-dependent DNA helicase RecQ
MIKTFLTIDGHGLSEQVFGNAPASSHASEAGGNDNLGDGALTSDAKPYSKERPN